MAKRKTKRRGRSRGLRGPSPAFVAAEKDCNKHLTNSKFKACMRMHGYWLH